MVKINDKRVGRGYPCYFIAELGINHNGSLDTTYRLIDEAVKVGAQGVKFQKRTIPVVYTGKELATPRKFDQSIIDAALQRCCIEGVEYQVFPEADLARLRGGGETTNGDLKHALEFGQKEYDLIDAYCKKAGITWSASAWDGQSATFVNGFDGVHWLKVASPCLTNSDLLRRVRSKGKPVILSTGGSTIEQVSRAVEILGTEDLVLLHCVSAYPQADIDANLQVMETLSRAFPSVPVGYSSHGSDPLSAIVAATMGACVIEAHLTLDQNMPGSDHKSSLNPTQFADMVRAVRRMESMRGDGIKRVLPAEVATMNKLRRVDDLFPDPSHDIPS